jgi:hypothetical protein
MTGGAPLPELKRARWRIIPFLAPFLILEPRQILDATVPSVQVNIHLIIDNHLISLA